MYLSRSRLPFLLTNGRQNFDSTKPTNQQTEEVDRHRSSLKITWGQSQCSISGSGFYQASGSGIRIQEGKMTHKNKKGNKFHVFKCWMLSYVGWRLSCSLDVLNRGLGLGKLQFDKNIKFFFQFSNFWSSKPWIRIWIDIQLKMLDPDPDSWTADLFLSPFVFLTFRPTMLFHLAPGQILSGQRRHFSTSPLSSETRRSV